jgi:hypothetical protein
MNFPTTYKAMKLKFLALVALYSLLHSFTPSLLHAQVNVTKRGITPPRNLWNYHQGQTTSRFGQMMGVRRYSSAVGDTLVGFLPVYYLGDSLLKVGTYTVLHSGNVGSFAITTETDPTVPAYPKTLTSAAVLLAQMLTVDGTGSGLDADLLDGQHGAFYQNASNLTAGTLALARLPIGTANQLLRTNAGATAAEWFTPTYLTANQTITLSGAVTGSGTTTITTTLSALGATTSGQVLTWNGSAWAAAAASGGITGSGTTNYVPKWSGSTALGNSQIFDNGTNVVVGGASPIGKMTVTGSAGFGKSMSFDNSEVLWRGDGLAHYVLRSNDGGVAGMSMVDVSATGNHSGGGNTMWHVSRSSGSTIFETFGRVKATTFTMTTGAAANTTLVGDGTGAATWQSLWYQSGGVKTENPVIIGSVSPSSTGHMFTIYNNYSSTGQASLNSFSAINLTNQNTTNNNWTAIQWSANNNGGISASLAAQYTNHASLYADLAISTRAVDGFQQRVRFGANGLSTIDGSAASPSMSFINDTDIGMYRVAANTLGFTTAGIERFRIGASGEVYFNVSAGSSGQMLQSNGAASPPTWVTAALLPSALNTQTLRHNGTNWVTSSNLANDGVNTTFTGSLRIPDGSAAAPAVVFSNDLNSGFFRIGADILGIALNGTEDARFSDGQMSMVLGSTALPAYSFTGDPNTGWWSPSADAQAWSTGGTERMRLTSSSFTTSNLTNFDIAASSQWSMFVGGQGLYGVSSAITAQTADFIIVNPLAAGLPAAGLQLFEDNDNPTPNRVRITVPTITANYDQTVTTASGEIGVWLRTVPVAIDFPSTGVNSFSEASITLTGAVVGKPCIPGFSTTVQGTWTAYCATAGIITLRFTNTSAVAIDPVSSTFEVHQKL